MKKLFQLSALALLPASTNLYAHHPATDFADEGIYTMADSLVADRADKMGGCTTETSITADSLSMFEAMAARGDLLEYVESLDGVVDTSISFNDDGSVTMTVNQLS